MPEQINNHVILNYIDKPARLLLWSADQVMVCICPFALGMITEHICLGITFSIVASIGFKWVKKKFGNIKIRSILYWNFLTSEKLVKQGLPPSHVRVWHR